MSTLVDADAFRVWMAPKVAAIQSFTSAVDSVAERHNGAPSSGSRARIELDGEHEHSAVSTWEKPITDCYTFAAMSLRAATDNVRGFGTLFTSGQPPMYPHLVLGRSAFEGAVVSEWLSEPSVEPLERIKRGFVSSSTAPKGLMTSTSSRGRHRGSTSGWRWHAASGGPQT